MKLEKEWFTEKTFKRFNLNINEYNKLEPIIIMIVNLMKESPRKYADVLYAKYANELLFYSHIQIENATVLDWYIESKLKDVSDKYLKFLLDKDTIPSSDYLLLSKKDSYGFIYKVNKNFDWEKYNKIK